MSKLTVTKLFIGGVIAVAAGGIVAIAAIWVAIANDVFVMNGPDVTAVRGSALAWATLGFALAGGLSLVVGLMAGLASWIGALLNTAQLERKRWFVGLLLLGVFNFGFVGMIAYLVAGPDGRAASPTQRGALPPVAA